MLRTIYSAPSLISSIKTLAKSEGMMSLQQSGIAALNAGKTSRQELQRVLLFD